MANPRRPIGRPPRLRAIGSNTITVLHASLDLKRALIRESAAAGIPLSLYVAAILTALGPEQRRALDLAGRDLAERERAEVAL